MKKSVLLIFYLFSFIVGYSQQDTNTVKSISQEPIDQFTSKIKNNVQYLYSSDGTLIAETSVVKKRRNFYTRTGLTIEYYKNGKVKCIGGYSNNKKRGLWKYYTEVGELLREEYWVNDFEKGYKYFQSPPK